jgi:hypothetical protein
LALLWQLSDANTVLTVARTRTDYDMARSLNQALERQQKRLDLAEKQRKRDAKLASETAGREATGVATRADRAELAKAPRTDVDVYLPEHTLSMGGTKVLLFSQAHVIATGRIVMKERHFTVGPPHLRRLQPSADHISFGTPLVG